MAVNLNRVTITGNLTHDPVLVPLSSGHSVCELRIACNRKWPNKLTGTWEQWTDYFDVRLYGELAPKIPHCLHKGSGVAIDGRLSSKRAHCDNPSHRLETVILADQIQFNPTPTTALEH